MNQSIKYDSMMDDECIGLCDALNRIPGIRTLESCCGHGRHGFWVWFTITEPYKNLTVVGRVFDNRYGGLEGWNCILDCTDCPETSPVFLISSNQIMGPLAYDQANKIAENLDLHMKHPEFLHIFGIQTQKTK